MGLFSKKRDAIHYREAGCSGAEGTPLSVLYILYGTQTGNAEDLAQDIADQSKRLGFAPKVHGLDDVSMDVLATMNHVLVVTSTFGDGEMPDNAWYFWEALSADDAPPLKTLTYGVLALGDTDRPQFCHAGRLIDARLSELGARRLVKRVDCDVEFQDDAEDWIASALPAMAQDATTE